MAGTMARSDPGLRLKVLQEAGAAPRNVARIVKLTTGYFKDSTRFSVAAVGDAIKISRIRVRA